MRVPAGLRAVATVVDCCLVFLAIQFAPWFWVLVPQSLNTFAKNRALSIAAIRIAPAGRSRTQYPHALIFRVCGPCVRRFRFFTSDLRVPAADRVSDCAGGD